ncbi:MAG: hypothetical protein CM15mP49_27340 [Actinomycetota bacterium]|nr:MAG: hypothetical protein CM15mP49_27340 [Actinomycetota bacterium]
MSAPLHVWTARCASEDGPLPPRPGRWYWSPDLEIGPGGGIGFPDAETGGALGTRCSGVVFVSEGFGLAALHHLLRAYL